MRAVLLIFALSLCAVAQTTQVPTVTLSGPVNDPTIENHSGKSVIAALVVYTPADKMPWVHMRLFTHDALGLPDGGSERFSANFAKHQKLESPIVSVQIRAVIFADGEFRGEDSYQDAAGNTIPAKFQSGIEEQMQLMRKTLQMAKAGDWNGVKAESDAGNLYAARLIFEHDRLGDAKAVDLLKHWELLPASTWKGGLLNKLRSAPGIQAIAEWIMPTAYAQSGPFCCTQPYPQESSTDAWHPDKWHYVCNTWPGSIELSVS